MRRGWLLLWVVALLVPHAVWAACTTANMAVSGAGNVPPRYFRCLNYADAPTTGLTAGDTLFVTATGASYTATAATTWTQQAGALPLPTSSLSVLGTGTKVTTTTATAPVSNKCLEMDPSGNVVIAGTNAACGAGGGGGTVSTTGSPASGNLTQFSGATTITAGNLSGDVTTSGTLATTVAGINTVALGSTTATSGNLLIGSGTQWVTHALSGAGATFALSATGVLTVSAIANASLANSALTLNGISVSLGGTRTLTLASADFATQGTTTTVLHGNAAGNPSFAAVVSADLNITTTSCTNQVVTALSAGAVGTCSSVANAMLSNSTISGVALGGTLNALTVDNASLQLDTGTTYTGAAVRTISVKAGGVTNAMLANSALTLNAGTNVGLTTPGAMTLGATYTLGTTGDHLRVSDLGLGVAAPTGGGQLALTLGADGLTGLTVKRFSTNTTGSYVDYQTSTGTSLWKVSHAGTLTWRPATNNPLGMDYLVTSNTPTNGGGGAYYYYNQLAQQGDTFPTATGTTTYGWNYSFQYGGAGGATGSDVGSKVALNSTATQTSAVSAVNPHDVVALQGVVTGGYSAGGTDTGAGAVGALFGGAFQVTPTAGATNYLQFAGLEIGMLNKASTSAKYRTGLSVVDYGNGGPQGAVIDCALCVTAATIVSGGGWGTGLLFSKSMGGQVPVTSGGTLIGVEGTVTVTHGLNFTGYTFSTDALKTPGFTVDGNGTVTVAYNGLGASLSGNGQSTASYNTSTNLGAAIELKDGTGAANSGGAVIFAGSQGRFAVMKGLLTDGSNNTIGDVVISTRNVNTDSTLTERLRVAGNGQVSVAALKTTGSAGSKHVVCVDTATGILYASSTTTDCSN